MVDFLEALRNIALNEPVNADPLSDNLAEGGMTTPFWTETMRMRAKSRFVKSLKQHAYDFLKELVFPCRYAKWSQFPVFLGDIFASGRCPSMSFMSNIINELPDFG